jgi:hypothetical protein
VHITARYFSGLISSSCLITYILQDPVIEERKIATQKLLLCINCRLLYITSLIQRKLMPVSARSKLWVCGRPLPEIAGSKYAKRIDVSYVNVVFCQLDVCASGRSLIQRSPTECGMFKCVREASIIWSPTGSVAPGGKINETYRKIQHELKTAALWNVTTCSLIYTYKSPNDPATNFIVNVELPRCWR